MAITYFASLRDAEVVDVDFVHTKGHVVTMKLLVDSGFTGSESFVLPRNAMGMVRKLLPNGITAGALTGAQDRGLVLCRVPGVGFEKMMIAIFSDLAQLCLPAGVVGMAGLTFLREFARWGAERTSDQKWRFFIESSGR